MNSSKSFVEHWDHGGSPSTYMIEDPSSIALMIPVRFTWGRIGEELKP